MKRIALTTAGLAFGIWESIDIFRIDVPAVAALFAAMFFAATIWSWRRDSSKAAAWLLVLFSIEAAVAPSLKQTATVTKASAFTLGVAGAVAAIAVLVAKRRERRAAAVAA